MSSDQGLSDDWLQGLLPPVRDHVHYVQLRQQLNETSRKLWRQLQSDCCQGFLWSNQSCSFDTMGTTFLVMFLQLSRKDQNELLTFDDSGFFAMFHFLLVTHYFSLKLSYEKIMMLMSNFCRHVMDFQGTDLSLTEAFKFLFYNRSPKFVRREPSDGHLIRGVHAMTSRCYEEGYYMDHLLLSTFTCPVCDRLSINNVHHQVCLDITLLDVMSCNNIQDFLNNRKEREEFVSCGDPACRSVSPSGSVELQRLNISPLLFVGVPSLADIDMQHINDPKLRDKRNAIIVQKRLTVDFMAGSNQGKGKTFELGGLAMFDHENNHFTAYIYSFGRWMFYDGMCNTGHFEEREDRVYERIVKTMMKKESFTLKELDENTRRNQSISVAGLFYRKVADQDHHHTEGLDECMSLEIEPYLTAETALKIKAALSQFSLEYQCVFKQRSKDEQVEHLQRRIANLEAQLKRQESTPQLHAVMAQDVFSDSSTSEPELTVVEQEFDKDSFQHCTTKLPSIEAPPSITLSTNCVIEIPPESSEAASYAWNEGGLRKVKEDINDFLQNYSKEVKHSHDISDWKLGTKTREVCCYEIDEKKYKDEQPGGFIFDSSKREMQYTVLAQYFRSNGRSLPHEKNIQLRKMIFMLHPKLWDKNYIASPLCQNKSCIRSNHLAFEEINRKNFRNNCRGGPFCHHTPRCLVPGINRRGKGEEIVPPDLQPLSNSFYIPPGGYMDIKEDETNAMSAATSETAPKQNESSAENNEDIPKVVRKRGRDFESDDGVLNPKSQKTDENSLESSH